jgi:hypothetical protein
MGGGITTRFKRELPILSSFPTHSLSGMRLTGFGTLPIPSEDEIRLPQFHRASPSTALDKKRNEIVP